MAGQTLSNKNSPTGLNAVQAELQKRKLTAEQRKTVLTIAESLRKNGSGGIGTLGKKLLQGIGILSNTEQGEELTDFEKAIKSGNTKGAINAAGDQLESNPNNQKTFADGNKNIYLKYKSEGRPVTFGVPAPNQVGLPVELGEQESGFFGEEPESQFPVELGEQESGFFGEDPRTKVSTIETTPVKAQEVDRIGTEKVDLTKPIIDYDLPESIIPPVDEEEEKEARERRLTRDQFVPDYGFDRVDQIMAQQKRTDDRRTLGDKVFGPKKKLGVEQSDKVIQTPAYTSGDDDRDDGGPSSGIDDFFGSDFGQTTYTPSPVFKSETAAGQESPQSFGVPAPAPKQAPTYDYDQAGPFYVGGVATKPMKPQRLKKGGLAKMKVKPKRMKKGGLASRKK